jgi:hypothetical protein
MYRELITAVSPRIGSAAVFARWPEIRERLAETPRRRKRQSLS